MSKIIVDKNMKGKLKVKNTKQGAKFSISIPKNSL
jgi:sensor histidine kinase regulating citrate/malate metabolism